MDHILPQFHFYEGNLLTWWQSEEYTIGPLLSKYIVSELTTRLRLSDADPASSFSATIFAAQHPFHYMYQDDHLEKTISEQFRRAFKLDLIIHRTAGDKIPAYVGTRPPLAPGEDRISRTYLDRLERLQRLELQGDGMKAFVSLVGRVQTENRPVQLIDEPEAFLHPPQARLISQIIATESRGQVFIATHSTDVLQGLLQSHSSRVSVIRLSRASNESRQILYLVKPLRGSGTIRFAI